jgi:RHS repeat-associated protein
MTGEQGLVSECGYNGHGDRVSQTVNGVTTHYTLDLNTGLTQVLADYTNTYLYGRGRISQSALSTPQSEIYFLTDALGSVRQLTDSTGSVTLAKSYTPYGETQSEIRNPQSEITNFGFTGEAADAETGLIFLRARYMNPRLGSFVSKDRASFDVLQPSNSNWYLYANGNPTNFTDPSGWCVFCGIGDLVSVDARPNGRLAIYDQKGEGNIVAYLADYQQVVIEGPSEQWGASRDEQTKMWRKVSIIGTEGTISGWVPNISLLDNCKGQQLFGCIPVDSWHETRYAQGFGPTYTAWDNCHDIKDFIPAGERYGDEKDEIGTGKCAYSNTRGLHNGLDFGADNGSALVWAGTGKGKVENIDGQDGPPAIFVRYYGAEVRYGHRGYSFVNNTDRSDVRPGQTIALSAENHSHFGVKFSNGWFANPLYYFTPHLQDKIVNAIALTKSRGYPTTYQGGPVSWDPYSMASFFPYSYPIDDGKCGDGTNFWKENPNLSNIHWRR